MEKLEVFEHKLIDGEPWFVGKDVASALLYKDTADAVKRHVDSTDELIRCFTDSGQKREVNKLTLGSLFDGIGGFPVAGLRVGIEPIWASEVEPFCIRVTQKHFPNVNYPSAED